jgi:hypothetical protein
MTFGTLKSKIDKKLLESYSNNTLSKELKNFKKLVLEDSNLSKVYHIYNELSTEKGFEKEFANDFLLECVDIYSRTNINPKKISELNKWVKNVTAKNLYEDIDNVLSKNTVIIENIINSKKSIVSTLTSKKENTEVINAPLEKIMEIANETLKDYLSTLNESEVIEIKKYLTFSESELNKRYEVLSEIVIEKLEVLKNNSDIETSSKINETSDKIKSDKIDAVSLIKLKSLTESL